jgi:hypothetical protein
MGVSIKHLLAIAIMFFCFTSCEVEFDPNEDWKAVTVVYGLLDQDEDTTFVRVQKGFLGSGNYLDFSRVKDSIYYNPEDIDVFMVSYYPWEGDNVIRDTFWFNYTESYNKENGDFYSESAPVYYCVTRGKLNHTEALKQEYKIIVRNKKTMEETTASARLIGDYDIVAPGSYMQFQNRAGKQVLNCQWYNINSSVASRHEGIMAKMYQPVIRFYYRKDGNETFVDIPFATQLAKNPNPGVLMSLNIELDFLLDGLEKELKGQSCSWTNRAYMFELYVSSCDLNMYEYYSNSRQESAQLVDKPIYTNVNNGYGLFAARRQNIKIRFVHLDEKVTLALKQWIND